jgi:hypothetical protein
MHDASPCFQFYFFGGGATFSSHQSNLVEPSFACLPGMSEFSLSLTPELGARLESVLVKEITAFRDRVYRKARGELLSPEVARLVVQLNDWIESGNWLKADRPIAR